MKQRKQKMVRQRCLAIFCLFTVLLTGRVCRESANASALTNAYSYYNSYGDSVRFWKTSQKDGDIYYATKGNTSTASVKYRTLGWKVSVLNMSGSKLQPIFFKLGGSYMRKADSRVKSGYENNLYVLSLNSLKGRMNSKASKALEAGTCQIRLDACMTTVNNGKVKGTLDDNGNTTGKVYSTYNGIAGAANWSSSARQSLYSYFDKEIQDLFYDLTVKKSTGIESVSGGGHYLYGTYVTVSAKVKKVYVVEQWKGIKQSQKIDCSM